MAWILIGYFSLFDFGIGRAVTKMVAEALTANRQRSVSVYSITAVLSLLILGTIVGVILMISANYIINDIMDVPEWLRSESYISFIWISASLPFVLGAVAIRGILEARGEFKLINYIRTPMSVVMYALPLVIIPFMHNILSVVIVLASTRVITFFIFFYYLVINDRFFIPTRHEIIVSLKLLFSFGAWITISNIIGPLMQNIDRFVVGALLSISALTYYSVPLDIVTKILVVASSVTAVLFPIMSGLAATNRKHLHELYNISVVMLALLLLPIFSLIIIMSEPFLFFWLGGSFVTNSKLILQILAIGVYINSLAAIPFTAIHALSRPDLTAKIHMMELPIYIILVWYLIKTGGVTGMALAWTIRMLIDGIMMFYLYYNIIDVPESYLMDNIAVCSFIVFSLLLVIVGSVYSSTLINIAIILFVGILTYVIIRYYYKRRYVNGIVALVRNVN